MRSLQYLWNESLSLVIHLLLEQLSSVASVCLTKSFCFFSKEKTKIKSRKYQTSLLAFPRSLDLFFPEYLQETFELVWTKQVDPTSYLHFQRSQPVDSVCSLVLVTVLMSSFSTAMSTDPHGSVKRRVSYFYDPDVGNYHYGMLHPMKVKLHFLAVQTIYGTFSLLQLG